jgi:hypothetical protein
MAANHLATRKKQKTCYLWDMYEQRSETARTIQAAWK